MIYYCYHHKKKGWAKKSWCSIGNLKNHLRMYYNVPWGQEQVKNKFIEYNLELEKYKFYEIDISRSSIVCFKLSLSEDLKEWLIDYD